MNHNTNENDALIYAIRNKSTGRMFIGDTKDIQTSVARHFLALQEGRKILTSVSERRKGIPAKNTRWQDDFNIYGKDDFEVYILEEGVENSRSARNERKNFWIKEYRTDEDRYGYNKMTAGLQTVEVIRGLPPRVRRFNDE